MAQWMLIGLRHDTREFTVFDPRRVQEFFITDPISKQDPFTNPMKSQVTGIHFTQVTPTCSIRGWKTIPGRLWILNRDFVRKLPA
jgi:hypothetical protein